MDKTAIRKNENLTKTAKVIFGDIVNSAYFTTWDINSKKSEVEHRINDNKFIYVMEEIAMRGDEIWIEFTNGKTVSFSVSEWGGIESADTENSYNI